MAIAYKGGEAVASDTASLPGGAAAGDFVLVQAFRINSATPPSLPTGWTSIGTNVIGATTQSERTGYKVLTVDDITAGTIGTWTGAQRVVFGVYYSNVGNIIEFVSGGTSEAESSTVFSIQGVTFGTSIVVLFGNCVGTSIKTKTLSHTFTTRSSGFTAPAAFLADSDGIVGSWSEATFTVSETDWCSRIIRLVEYPVIEFTGIAAALSNTVSIPGGVTSNATAIVLAHRNSVTLPGIASGYTSVENVSVSANSSRLAFKRFDNADVTSGSIGTWSNANAVIAMFYEAEGLAVDVRNVEVAAGDGTSVTLPAQTDADLWQSAMAFHRTGVIYAETPSGYDNQSSGVGIGRVGAWNTEVTPVGSRTVTASVTGEWSAYTFTLCLAYTFEVDDDLSSSTLVGSPALTQSHVFATPGNRRCAPEVGSPALTQRHKLVATGLLITSSVGNARLGVRPVGITVTPDTPTPILTQKHALVATGITVGPDVSSPAISQKHAITATAVRTSPVVPEPALIQVHGLTATSISTGSAVDSPASSVNPPHIASSPRVGSPAISQRHVISPAMISVGPVVSNPVMTQVHDLVATGITVVPTVGNPGYATIVDLIATGITVVVVLERPTGLLESPMFATSITMIPLVSAPALTQRHVLEAVGFIIEPKTRAWADCEAVPVRVTTHVDTPQLGWYTKLLTVGLTVGSPALTQVHELTASGITVDQAVNEPRVSQVHAITALGFVIEPNVTAPSTAQSHNLQAVTVRATPDVPTVTLTQNHGLVALGPVTSPVTPAPQLRQTHINDTTEVTVTHIVGSPGLTQRQANTATGVTISVVVGTPALTQRHRLAATTVKPQPTVDNPVVTIGDGLQTSLIKVTPILGQPALNQNYVLTAVGISFRTKVTPGPTVTVVHVVSPSGVTTVPTVGSPVLTQHHTLQAVGLASTVIFSAVNLTQGHTLIAKNVTAWTTVRQSNNFSRILTGQT